MPRIPDRRKVSWLEFANPLLGMSLKQCQQIYDSARRGNFARLHKIYEELEAYNPTLLTCVERRQSAISAIGWRVTVDSTAEDAQAAEAQRDYLSKRLSAYGRQLTDAIEHLDLAFFRGASIVVMDGDRLAMPESWQLCYDRFTGVWYYNPEAAVVDPSDPGDRSRLIELPADQVIAIRRKRAIDYPAMFICLRSTIAERDWGRFLERYGIPPAIFTMPPNSDASTSGTFAEVAAAIANGQSGAIPDGSKVDFASEARGTEPFSAFLEHQQKLIVLLATGGTLTSLAESGSGTLAGNAQMDVWKDIVARDAVVIGDAIDSTLCRRILEQAFPGQPILAHFAVGGEEATDPNEMAQLYGALHAAGLDVDPAEASEATGLTLSRQEPSGMGLGMYNSAPATVQNAEPEAKTVPADISAGLAALANDMHPIKERVQALLAETDQEKRREMAKKLAEDLPGLLPDDPELAAVIEEEIAKEFADTVKEEQDA